MLIRQLERTFQRLFWVPVCRSGHDVSVRFQEREERSEWWCRGTDLHWNTAGVMSVMGTWSLHFIEKFQSGSTIISWLGDLEQSEAWFRF